MRPFLSAVLFLSIACHSGAFVVDRTASGNPLRWNLLTPTVHTNLVNPSTHALRYFLASDAFSTTNTAAELNALRASFGQWQAVSGTHLKFEDAGLVAPGIDIDLDDNQNVVFWAKSSPIVFGGMANISGSLGRTFISFFSDGRIAEADIVLNGFDYDWFTDFTATSSTFQFIEGTALHEIGHMVGLVHSPVGGASLMWVGSEGVDTQAGLSPDEISAARAHYPSNAQIAMLSALRGQVTKSGIGVFGAAVTLETSAGNVVAGTVTRSTGDYELAAVAPGSYQVRVSPLDPSSAFDWLIRGRDIDNDYNGADTSFLPTPGQPIVLTGGATNTLNLSLTAGNPAFRITYIRATVTNAGQFIWASLPTTLQIGQSNVTVGVASADLPTNGATLTITGDGLLQGPLTFRTNAFGTGLNFISTRVSVLSNATPGLRTFVVQKGSDVAYANAFVEVLPRAADYNFDGVADVFQRQYFPLWTAPIAGPAMDPDGDAFPNSSEAIAGTNPTNALSRLEIDSVTTSMSGALVTWQSVAGKRYQLSSKAILGAATWSAVGTPVTATGPTAQRLDPAGVSGARFYRVEVLP